MHADHSNVRHLSKEPLMETSHETLEVTDLGDAKEVTKGPYTTALEEDSLGMIHKAQP
jgi:hypothetical protein